MSLTVSEGVIKGTLANNENIGEILMLLQGAKRIAVDTETTGLNVRNRVDYLMGVCVYSPDVAAYLPFRHKVRNLDRRYFDFLWDILCTAPELDWHNMKFDFHSFATMGVDPMQLKGQQFCSMLAFSLWNEELYSKEMDYLAKRFLKMEKYQADVIKSMGDIYGRENLEPEVYRNYGPQDTYVTWKLRDFVEPKLKKEGLYDVFTQTEMPYNKLLYLKEHRAVGVHPEFCERKTHTGNGRMATIRRQLGFDPASRNDLKEFLLGKMGLPILYHTDKCQACREGHPVESHEGSPSFNKTAMNDYDDILSLSNDPTARLVNEFRGWQKAVTSLYVPLLEKRGPDGLIRTEFHQHRTVTGRLSSSNPNLQQVPRTTDKPWNGDAKSAFHSGRDGFALYGWDYGQLELRLAAAYGREAILLAEFEKDDADPFAVLAPQIFGILTPDTRHDTKNKLVYPSLYGAGLKKVALGLGKPVSEAAPIYNRYKASIPGITAVSEQVRDLVKQRGWVRYWDGRIRHIRNKEDVHTRAWNSVLQGGAAQLVKQTSLKLQALETSEAFMVLQVHDEVTWAIKREVIPEVEPEIKKIMTTWPQFGVRFTVEGKEWK